MLVNCGTVRRYKTRTGKLAPLLTQRQRQILQLLAEGATREHVAKTLVLSEGTVNAHVSLLLERLEARNVAHAVYLAACQHLLPLQG